MTKTHLRSLHVLNRQIARLLGYRVKRSASNMWYIRYNNDPRKPPMPIPHYAMCTDVAVETAMSVPGLVHTLVTRKVAYTPGQAWRCELWLVELTPGGKPFMLETLGDTQAEAAAKALYLALLAKQPQMRGLGGRVSDVTVEAIVDNAIAAYQDHTGGLRYKTAQTGRMPAGTPE